jgi:DNA-binding beta-propeller fold protein YncE
LTVDVRATDRKLAYVGYRFGPPANVADSVATADAMSAINSTIVIPAGWVGTTSASMFAVDSAGNRVTIPMGDLTIATRTRKPVAMVARPGPVQDAAIDLKRGVVYMSIPQQKRVAVLSLSDMTFGSSIDFRNTPRGIDLTSGGDSLLVAQLEGGDVGVVNLPTKATTYLPVTGTYGPDFLRVMNTNKLLLTTTFAGSGFGGTVLEVDLRTGAKRQVATVTEITPLAASGNRGRILIYLGDESAVETIVYDAASQSILADRGTVGMNSGAESVDFSGTRFMMSSTVYDAHLNYVAAYQGSSYNYGASQLALNGQSGYLATETGILHVRFSDGALLESFALPEQPYEMWLSRDGLTLFAVGATNVYVIDLW